LTTTVIHRATGATDHHGAAESYCPHPALGARDTVVSRGLLSVLGVVIVARTATDPSMAAVRVGRSA